MSKFSIPDPGFERPFRTPSRRQQLTTLTRQEFSAEGGRPAKSIAESSPKVFDYDLHESSSDSISKVHHEHRFEIRELRNELARCRTEANELRQERSELLSRQVEQEIILTSLHGQRLEEHRRIAVLQKNHEANIGSTLQAAKATREMLEGHIYQQSRSYAFCESLCFHRCRHLLKTILFLKKNFVFAGTYNA